MNFNNKGTYAVVGIAVFIISKIILGRLGIENIPVPISIGVLAVIGISNKKLIRGERSCYIVLAILFAVVIVSAIIMALFLSYFPQIITEYKVLLLVLLISGILALLGIIIISMIIIKKYR